jgi:arsenate reductase-like glutaredoxin family protein
LVKHNLATTRPPRELLGRLIDERGLEAVLNKRSPAYKERGLGERVAAGTLSKKEALDLIEEDPNLMRRPLVLNAKGKTLLGYDAEGYATL